MRPYRLSKSKIISGLQCPKRLYLEVHNPELRIDSARTESLFNMGHRVGEVAQQLVPGGVMIGMVNGLGEAIRETSRYLRSASIPPLFEATFSYKNVLVRADLFFQNTDGYRLVEVKASTSVKDYHLNDCAVQAWVVEGCGYALSTVELAHIDTSFIYPGGNKYDGLFHNENITDQVNTIKNQVPIWVGRFQNMLSGDMPTIEIGDHCSDPFDCPFMGYCWPDDPDYPVGILPRGRQVAGALIAEGIEDVRDIPEGHLNNPIHERVRKATVTRQPYIDDRLKTYLESLPYPRFYLDFETIGTAVPIWVGTRPYQAHLPFQWSLHIEREPSVLSHKEFLDLSGSNPIRDLAVKLINDIGDEGPIFVYSHFEKSVLTQIGAFYPELNPDLESIIERLVDLLPLVRNHYYHPDQMGSWSIKAVLPTVAPELDYGDLVEVQDGGGAQDAYLEACSLGPGSERLEPLQNNMLEYCKLDTLALVRLVNFFENVVTSKVKLQSEFSI